MGTITAICTVLDTFSEVSDKLMSLLSDSVHSQQHDDLRVVFKCSLYFAVCNVTLLYVPELEGAEASATVVVTLRLAAQHSR